MTSLTLEASSVALCLSAVTRLRQAFEASNSAAERQALLLAAGDMLDHTMPFPDLKQTLSGVADQVQALVSGRERIAAVPPGLWRPARVRPNELGSTHYSGLRAVERALRKEFDRPDLLWPALESWLTPAWARYPELKPECLWLKQQVSPSLVAQA